MDASCVVKKLKRKDYIGMSDHGFILFSIEEFLINNPQEVVKNLDRFNIEHESLDEFIKHYGITDHYGYDDHLYYKLRDSIRDSSELFDRLHNILIDKI